MRKILIGGLCATMIAGLAACNDKQTETKTAEAAKPQTTQTATAAAVSKALGSGIDFANFDKSVRPQDDFYSYVNGTWIKNTEIPADRTSTGAFYDLREKSRDDIKAIIEEVAAQKDLKAGTDEQKVADLYRAFMDTTTLNQLGIDPLKPELAKIDAIGNKDQLMAYFGSSQIIGGGTPMAFYVDVDAKDSTRYATHIWQYGLSLPEKDYYFNDAERFVKIREAFVEHMRKMFKLAGFEQPRKSAEAIMKLETAIAKDHWDVVASRDSTKTYNKYALKDLAELAPGVDWNAYLTALGADKQADIIINQPSYVTGLAKIINDTDLATWKTYLRWHLLTSFAGDLGEAFDNENFDFYSRILNGQEEQQPRWKRGVSKVNSLLGEVVGKVYVKRHFTPEAKARMEQLVENLRQAYADSVDELDWMTPETKAAAKAKLAKFNPKIGYPNKWEDYSQLTISATDLVGDEMRAGEVEHQKDLKKLNSPIDRDEWHMTPQTVNAYYNPTMNEIVFPAAILQPPFFNMEADDAVNYGGIGAVIGHEMGHGFDDQGAKFDGDGNMRDWWTQKDLDAFHAKTKALVAQYNGYYVFPDLHVNGELTLGENIGDLSGVTIAYKAYKKSLEGKEAPVIDGLSGDQRFFIGFAQIWRAKVKEEALRNRVATDPHSPAKFRAIGSLENMPQFYATFDVKPGDAMYLEPANRVKIW
ncbi:peptidase M13 [Shewanella sp. 4t3-1-2LB]|uniref:M13 family metallopeptidase n=1 Tax=Shewanella sp. 4t3-1-2LB TaxID=2817682 RepID=UPI001A98DA0A|nr:M13-type metalloendopeptidase [Shewanella sp. 4t3-1-2LB]MBO1273275.1 peptidase M13 [Shewanella sp. 4t3-1-2LB]